MKILQVNKFFYPKGGAEYVFFDTVRVFEKMGHRISFFSMHQENNLSSAYEKYFVSAVDYGQQRLRDKLTSSLKILYSWEAKRKIEQLICDERPDIAHLNNIYHQISPSILHSLKKAKVPIVMTLHDFKLVCASYYMLHKGKACQACKGKKYYHCFFNGCVKNSRAKSLLNTLEMYLHHHILRIYDLVDVFIAPSMFLKSKLEAMGFKGKVVYLPNFVELDNFQPEYSWEEKSIVFFGRLAPEKGVLTLLEAMKKNSGITLKIIGEGPIKGLLEEKVKNEKIINVKFLGYKKGRALKEEIAKSMFVVFPSECLENNPRVVIEAFALGKPVLGANIGGVPELVKDNLTGLLFVPGNADDLAFRIKYLSDNPQKIIQMGKNGRRMIEGEMSSEKHYQKLLEIYEKTVSSHN